MTLRALTLIAPVTPAPATIERRPARARHLVRAAIGAGVLAATLLLSFAAHRVPYFQVDLAITRAVQATDLGLLAAPLRVLDTLGFPPVAPLVYGGVILTLVVVQRRPEALACGFAALGGAGINHLVKLLVNRPRPDADLVHVARAIGNPSYPAGHVLNFTAVAGLLAAVACLRMQPSWGRSTVVSLLATMIALMGLARIASGEHWPSDVLGGYLLGALWLAVTLRFYAWTRRRLAPARPGAVPAAGRRTIPAGVALWALWVPLALVAVPAGAQEVPAPSESLGTSTGVPWNPPHALARRRGWEQAVLLPGRLVSLPLAGVGFAADKLLFVIEQDPRFGYGTTFGAGPAGRAVVVRTARMGDRTGLGGALELRRTLLHGALASTVSAEYAVTLHHYDRTMLTWTGRPLYVQYGYEWRPGERFYGVGNAAPTNMVSDYASQTEFVRTGMAWESNRVRDPARAHSALGIWGGSRSRVTRGGRGPGDVSYATRFPALGDATLDRRVENLDYGASLLVDHRAGAPHWSHGWRTLLSAERLDAPARALALHSGAGDGARFTRYGATAEAGFSFMRDPRTVRLLVHATDLQAGEHADRLLLSDLSTLGGQAGLGGYEAGRFHDMDLLLTRLDYVFPLQRRFEVDLHSEWGGVYADLWNDPKPNTLHHSFGFELRVRNDQKPRAAIGCDFSRESVRIRYSIGGTE